SSLVRFVTLMVLTWVPKRSPHPLTGDRHPRPAQRILRPGPAAAPWRPGTLMRGSGKIDPNCMYTLPALFWNLYMPCIPFLGKGQSLMTIEQDAVNMQRRLQIELHPRLNLTYYFIGDQVVPGRCLLQILRPDGNVISLNIPPGSFGSETA